MGIIRRIVTLHGSCGRRRVNALFDSGSSVSLVREDVARRVGSLDELQDPVKFEAASGTFVVEREVCFRLRFRGEPMCVAIKVVPSLTEEFILGADLMQKLGIILDLPAHRVRVRMG